MGLLTDLAKALYEAKMGQNRKSQTEKAEESHIYKIDLNEINEKQNAKKRREDEAIVWKYKLEYERLKQKGFTDEDIRKIFRIDTRAIKILSKQKLWC